MNLVELLRTQAVEQPATAAIIDAHAGRERVTSFLELERASARAAAALRAAGLRPGDGVLVLCPMRAELYGVMLGIFRLGLVAMFLDPSAGLAHIERCCALHAPRGLVATPKAQLLRLVSRALRRIPIKLGIGGLLRHPAALDAIEPCAPDTPALLTFTSGSTGQPKAALRTHGFLLAQHRVLQAVLELNPGQVDLTTLPIFCLANLASGVTTLIPDADLRFPGAIEPERVMRQIQARRPMRTVASPALLERLADYCAARGHTLASFQKIFTGGAPVFPRLLDKLQSLTPNGDVVALYGSTEAEPIAHLARREMRPSDLAAMTAGRGLLTGPPVPAIQLRILRHQWGQSVGPYTRATFDAACMLAGEPGEIVVSGEHVLRGYLHGLGDEETKFDVDNARWHRTGDEGYLDGEGRLWMLGRCSAQIVDARGTLYPFSVECAASQHPAVRRAAAVAINGRRVLVIEPHDFRQPPDLDSLRQTLVWAQLDELRIVQRIPVDSRHQAKVDYPRLHELLGLK